MRRSSSDRLTSAAIFVMVTSLFLLVGSMDHTDAVKERDHYCRNVADGTWPDYRHIYATECRP